MLTLDDIGFQVLGEIGLGLGPAEDITTATGLLGGALYQRTVARVRTFSLIGVLLAASLGGLQRAQAELHAALTPFGLAEQQPLALRYRAMDARGEPMGEDLELLCHYTGGLEGATDNLYGERCALQFAQYLPQITSTGEAAVALGTTESITDANYVVERQESGVWHALNGGVGGGGGSIRVTAAIYGPDGNLYIGGHFTEAYNAAGGGSPVTVNHIAKWDGTSWSALGSGFNDDVATLVFDAAGTLYAGGFFTDAANPYLAQWDGASWSPVGLAADATDWVRALAFDADGLLWIGGAFTNWAGSANADRIVTWDGTNWATLGTGANDEVYAIVRDPARAGMVVAGEFTVIGATFCTRIARWNGQYWEPFADGANGTVRALAVGRSGILYMGGAFSDAAYPYLAQWNGTSWEPLGSGISSPSVLALDVNQATGVLAAGGFFAQAGDLPINDRVAQWSGTTWWPFWIDLPGSPSIEALASTVDGRIAVGYTSAGSATATVADTTVVNTGSAPAAPILTVTGPGRLEHIVNWTTGAALFFDLTLQAGEVVTIDLTPGAIRVVSSVLGNVGGQVLPGSALASWRLLPGENTIVSKSTAPVTLRWRPTYLSIQGGTP